MLPLAACLSLLLSLQETSSRKTRELVERLRCESIDERDRAVVELVALRGAARPGLERALEDPDSEVALRAREALRSLSVREKFTLQLEKSLPWLLEEVEQGRVTWAQAFLVAADRLRRDPGPLTKEDLVPLAAGALIRGHEVNVETQRILPVVAELGLSGLVPRLFEMLDEPDPPYEYEVIRTLQSLGAREAIPALARRVGSRHRQIRDVAVATVRALGLKEAVPELLPILEHSSPEARERAVVLLSEAGAREAIPALRSRLKDPSFIVREAAVLALGNLGDEEAVESLAELVKDPDSQVRIKAIQALARFRTPEGARAVLPALDDEWVVVRQEALHALAVMGAKEAVPAIVKRLEDRALRQSALYALGTLQAREAAPEVRKHLEDRDPYVRLQAARALREMGVEPTLAPAAPAKRE